MMYRDNTAYDFDLFTPKKKEIVEIPVKEKRNSHRTNQQTAASPRNRFMAVAGVAVVLLLLIAQLHCQLQTSETVDQISQTEKNIEILQSENTRLQVELNGKVSFTNMETAAKEKGMQKVTVAQTEYINLCEEDVSAVVEEEGGLLASIKEIF